MESELIKFSYSGCVNLKSIASTQISITHNDRFRISGENICPVCFINQTQALKRSSLNQNRSIDRSAFLFSKNKCFPSAID